MNNSEKWTCDACGRKNSRHHTWCQFCDSAKQTCPKCDTPVEWASLMQPTKIGCKDCDWESVL